MKQATDLALEPVVGLEVHAQLLTQSKMFCSCSARYADAEPNTLVCAVCGGMPGSLPVINARAVEFTIRTALALHCDTAAYTKFDRKNYQYPDIPKGYQISQYDVPIGRHGYVDYQVNGHIRRCGIVRVHLEEDTGKSFHLDEDGREVSLVDYNRSGVPLMEIVTEPDLRSPEEAREFFASLRQTLLYLGVCDGKLQEGSMRADVNVSLRRPGDPFGTKVEIKNLNSFRAVQRALEYEIERQRQVLLSGEPVVQETRGWSEATDSTVSQRTKEYAHDYRYFPEPDLPPLAITAGQVERIRAELPEMPEARVDRLTSEYGIKRDLAVILSETKQLGDYFEETARGADAGAVANWLSGEVMRKLKENGSDPLVPPFPPDALASLVSLVHSGEITGTAGKSVLDEMFESGSDPAEIVDRRDLRQIRDLETLERLVEDLLIADRQQKLIGDYRRGKAKALEGLVGAGMAATRGRADAAALRRMFTERLGPPGGKK